MLQHEHNITARKALAERIILRLQLPKDELKYSAQDATFLDDPRQTYAHVMHMRHGLCSNDHLTNVQITVVVDSLWVTLCMILEYWGVAPWGNRIGIRI